MEHPHELHHFDARNSTISTPSPMRMRMAGSTTERPRAGVAGTVSVSLVVVLSVAEAGCVAEAIVSLDVVDVAGGGSLDVSSAVSATTVDEATAVSTAVDAGRCVPPAAGDVTIFWSTDVAAAGTAAAAGDAEGLGVPGVGFAAAGLVVDEARLEGEGDCDDARGVLRGARDVVLRGVLLLRGGASDTDVRLRGVGVARGTLTSADVDRLLRAIRGAVLIPSLCRRSAPMRATKSRDSAAG
jgi:hypothetical protein